MNPGDAYQFKRDSDADQRLNSRPWPEYEDGQDLVVVGSPWASEIRDPDKEIVVVAVPDWVADDTVTFHVYRKELVGINRNDPSQLMGAIVNRAWELKPGNYHVSIAPITICCGDQWWVARLWEDTAPTRHFANSCPSVIDALRVLLETLEKMTELQKEEG